MRRSSVWAVSLRLILVSSLMLAACGGEAEEAPIADSDTAIAGEAALGDDTAVGDDSAVEAEVAADEAGEVAEGAEEPTSPPPPPVEIPDEPPVFQRPEHVRGIYLNAWASGSSAKVGRLIELAKRTDINAFVIDIKDATGYVSHSTAVPLAREIGATGEIRIGNLPALLWRLHDAGIYPIARIVIVKDPLLIEGRPDLAVQDTAGGVWVDSKGIRWLNAYHKEVWDYHVDLAREVAHLGFPEIQWDYVRFPDAPLSDLERSEFPGSEGEPKPSAIRRFLEYSRSALAQEGVTVTADVFGITTSAHDVGIGQVWEEFIGAVDVALPMVYPSHYYRGSYGYEHPNAYPYEVVKRALQDAQRKSAAVEGAGATRPWLQAFSLGEPPYGPAEIQAQMHAAYDVGIEEWILWHPGSNYDEAALTPADGDADPLIRIADQVVPASRRFDVLEARAAEVADSLAALEAREAAEAAIDTTRVPEPTGTDTLSVPARPTGRGA